MSRKREAYDMRARGPNSKFRIRRDWTRLLEYRSAEDPVRTLGLLIVLFASTLVVCAQGPDSNHKITVTFDFDFTHTPLCSPAIGKACVQQFNLYDISEGIASRTKLMSFSPPAEAHGFVKGITVTTPLLPIKPGKHLLAVTAQLSKGGESDPNQCTVWVQVPR